MPALVGQHRRHRGRTLRARAARGDDRHAHAREVRRRPSARERDPTADRQARAERQHDGRERTTVGDEVGHRPQLGEVRRAGILRRKGRHGLVVGHLHHDQTGLAGRREHGVGPRRDPGEGELPVRANARRARPGQGHGRPGRREHHLYRPGRARRAGHDARHADERHELERQIDRLVLVAHAEREGLGRAGLGRAGKVDRGVARRRVPGGRRGVAETGDRRLDLLDRGRVCRTAEVDFRETLLEGIGLIARRRVDGHGRDHVVPGQQARHPVHAAIIGRGRRGDDEHALSRAHHPPERGHLRAKLRFAGLIGHRAGEDAATRQRHREVVELLGLPERQRRARRPEPGCFCPKADSMNPGREAVSVNVAAGRSRKAKWPSSAVVAESVRSGAVLESVTCTRRTGRPVSADTTVPAIAPVPVGDAAGVSREGASIAGFLPCGAWAERSARSVTTASGSTSGLFIFVGDDEDVASPER